VVQKDYFETVLNITKNMENNHKILIIALGNDIMGDDAVSLEVARHLKQFYKNKIIVEEVFGGGLELLDLMEGMDKVLIIDSISTGNYQPGTILVFTENEFSKIAVASPHYIGLPEVIDISRLLDIDFPKDYMFLAIETEPQLCVKQGLSPYISTAIPEMVEEAKVILDIWTQNIESEFPIIDYI
jgi:hydrogenase maturation protease